MTLINFIKALWADRKKVAADLLTYVLAFQAVLLVIVNLFGALGSSIKLPADANAVLSGLVAIVAAIVTFLRRQADAAKSARGK